MVLDNIDAAEKDLKISLPSRRPTVFKDPTPEPVSKPANLPDWKLDPEISFYGPGFYGNWTACGKELTRDLQGVANRDLPCGTLVTFNWEGMTRTFPVVDRGPYVEGRIFDLTGGACMAFSDKDTPHPKYPKGHCFTGPINYIIGKPPSDNNLNRFRSRL
jgi:rare lipoprotein A